MRSALDFALLNPLQQFDQPLDVHCFRETILNRLMHERMVRNLAIADDVFAAGELVGKHGGQEILRFHSLQGAGILRPPR
jgi:hypothetical protein